MKISRIDELMIQNFIIDNNLLFDIYALINYSQLLQHGINLWKGESWRVFTSIICSSSVILFEPYECNFPLQIQ